MPPVTSDETLRKLAKTSSQLYSLNGRRYISNNVYLNVSPEDDIPDELLENAMDIIRNPGKDLPGHDIATRRRRGVSEDWQERFDELNRRSQCLCWSLCSPIKRYCA